MPTPSVPCASPISPAEPARCCRQCTNRLPLATSGPAATLQHLHPAMMEEVLYGCDVMPSAIHITGSTLSGAQPNIGFGQSRLYTMPYGHQSDCTVKIGSLELLQSSAVQTLFNTSDPALRTGSVGEERLPPPRAGRLRPCALASRDDGGGSLRVRRKSAIHITGSTLSGAQPNDRCSGNPGSTPCPTGTSPTAR